jgi:DNA polymerase-1
MRLPKQSQPPPKSFSLTNPDEWGVINHAVFLSVNDESLLNNYGPVLSVDVEDNEAGSLVGIGLYDGSQRILYFTELTQLLKNILETCQFVGHHFKSDLHKLRSWGVNVNSNQLVFDTCIASYVMNSTKESHGLKELAWTELGITYPSYRDIVGSGRNRKTLDLQPVELVAQYNAMDCFATYKLWQKYYKSMSKAERQYFTEIELPITRLLFEMEEKGIKVDENYLRDLDARFGSEASILHRILLGYCGSAFNPNAPKQVASRLLGRFGYQGTSSAKDVLGSYLSIPLVSALTRFRELQKLRGTYTTPLVQLASEDKAARIHTTFNQVAILSNGDTKGIRTGRLSSSEPNLHNIPTRTETGNLLRRSFIASEGTEGKVLICADYSQIEWRLAAHFSGDSRMAEAIKAGDPYKAVAEKAKVTRGQAKTAMLAMNFGAGGYKLAAILKVSDREGFNFLNAYEATYPDYFNWRKKIERQPFVTTILGRQIKPDADNLKVPYMIQGSAADIIKKAMLNIAVNVWLVPLLQVHDELIYEVEEKDAESCVKIIKNAMEKVITLSVPLCCEPGIGKTWDEAKDNTK